MRWTQTVVEKTESTPSAVAEPTEAAPVAPSGIEIAVLFVLSLLWLAATLRLADSLLLTNASDGSQLASAVSLALPTVVYASLLAGAAAGLVAGLLRWVETALTPKGALLRRIIVGLVAGLILGAVTVVTILLRYGGHSAIVVLAITVGAAALVGGVAAAVPRAILAAGVTGTLELFFIGVLVGYFQAPLKSFFGATSDPASQVSAATWLAVATAITQGVVVGLSAYFSLRRRLDQPRWPAFAIAGVFPGVLLLVGLVLSLIGGSGLSNIGGELSDADRLVRDVVNGAGLNQALTVAFVGTIVAMILYGRTLRSVEDDE